MTKPQKVDSITKVNPKHTHGIGIWGNPRVVMGVRVDSELKKRFSAVSKRVFGSTCNPIESFMATVISCAESGVNFGNTVNIERIVIERNLRERRRLELDKELSDESPRCHYCGTVAVGLFHHVKSNIDYPLCSFHAFELLQSKAWISKEETKASLPKRNEGLDKASSELRKELQGFLNFEEKT